MKLLQLIISIATCIIFSGQVARADELLTKNYKINIEQKCEEGNVTCDNVTYLGIHRTSGKSIRLKGTTRHTFCKDGVTPCRFLGYEFKNGNISYFVSEDGTLTVTRNKTEVIIDEKGEWQ